ncbi:MAG: amino acid transporter [Bacteroidetes bacterium GWF2_43_11]|nr:MAG: amino acid transporter [Bacteroidetes bacterium GWF2_43_11]
MSKSPLFRQKTVAHILDHASSGDAMKRTLSVRDLTAMGIAAIIGAGIFSTIGNAAADGGPAVSLLFIFTAVACAFSAMCYAQFASAIPVSGSAYTYAYASFGELMAWIIGWDLIMEYAVGNIAVAISWSEYFTGWLSGIGLHIPEWLTIDYLSASRGYTEAVSLISSGTSIDALSRPLFDAWHAWLTAPTLLGVRVIADIPAFSIVVAISYLVFKGIYESKTAGNMMVLLKLAILLLVISVGAFYVKPANWSPFAPNGVGGVLKGVAGVFFAYIGFDAISTTAEECKTPRRDLPLSMIYALVISTVIYVLVSLVLTGMVPSGELGVADPLAYAFEKLNLNWLSGFIAVSAVIAMAGVILVFQLGQPRIWMSMSRDGLLPPIFSRLHPRYRTPWFSTIVAGVIVAIPSLFMNLTEVTDLTSIGTLFAFMLVSGGILILDSRGTQMQLPDKAFRVPYFNSRLWLPIIWISVLLIIFWNKGEKSWLNGLRLNEPWDTFRHEIPNLIFYLFALAISILAVLKRWSVIPVLGLLTNGYLIAQLGITNWLRFLIWLAIGLFLYFVYGSKHSLLRKNQNS